MNVIPKKEWFTITYLLIGHGRDCMQSTESELFKMSVTHSLSGVSYLTYATHIRNATKFSFIY